MVSGSVFGWMHTSEWRSVLFAFFGAVFGPSLLAWSDTGHKVIGSLAYERLSPTARANADALLAVHPHYELLLKKGMPSGTSLNRWVFLQATTWPDMVRPTYGKGRKPIEITRFHRSTWHYVNIPYVWPADATLFANSRLGLTGDLLKAIATCSKTVADRKASAAVRAVHLAWLLHLIGDLHQPLHAIAMYSVGTPQGDQGGNLVAVRRGNTVIKLHSFWDGLLGTGESLGFIESVASSIASAHLRKEPSVSLPELIRRKDAEGWVQESAVAAIDIAYLNGRLPWRSYSDWDRRGKSGLKAKDIPALDPDYLITAREAARRRAALAAMRLAALLNQLLK